MPIMITNAYYAVCTCNSLDINGYKHVPKGVGNINYKLVDEEIRSKEFCRIRYKQITLPRGKKKKING